MISDEEASLVKIFNPYFFDQCQRIAHSNGQFVHYTSADAAMKMLDSRAVWMRNARTMNDFSEVEYGRHLLIEAYRGPIGKRLRQCLDVIDPTIKEKIETLFNGWSPQFPQLTYLTCFSEHDAQQEDTIGRLSMWRAYGGPVSVALVLNNKPFLAPTDVLSAFTNPVLYADSSRFLITQMSPRRWWTAKHFNYLERPADLLSFARSTC